MNAFVIYSTIVSLIAAAKKNDFNDSSLQDEEIDKIPLNITHIILQSVLFCGTDILCDKSILLSLNIPDNLTVSGQCTHCSRYNSCPDYFFRFGYLQCKNVNIYSRGPKKSHLVIASCPPSANKSLVDKCLISGPDNDDTISVPVLGFDSYMVYRNKFCAHCSQEHSYREFDIVLTCPETEDFNFISSYAELKQIAEEKSCNLSFEIPNFSPEPCEENNNKNKVASCNVTGTWRHWDVQIEKACRSGYECDYGAFKNIFCAMCNPPIFQQDNLIDSCVYENPQADLCVSQSVVEASFPYKNYFCIGCNHVDMDSKHFFDVNLDYISETYTVNNTLEYEVTMFFSYSKEHINSFIDKKSLNSKLKRTILDNYENNSSTLTDLTDFAFKDKIVHLAKFRYFCSHDTQNKGAAVLLRHHTNTLHSINITKLVYASFAMTKYGVCAPELLPTYTHLLQKKCSCVSGCISQCCDDFALQQSWACTGLGFLGENEGVDANYRVISGCPFSNRFQKLCATENSSDFYQNVPVYTTNGYKETYLNVFCYICGQIGNDINTDGKEYSLQDVWPWPLQFKCNHYVNYRYFRYVQELVKYLRQSQCTLTFTNPDNAMKCNDSCDVDISTCNTTGTWKTFDKDIITACEYSDIFTFPRIISRSLIFKNKYCIICNPLDVNDSEMYHTCYHKNDSNLVTACQEFPAVHACSKFKNVFCEECHSLNASNCSRVIHQDIHIHPIIIEIRDKKVYWDFRFTFSLSSYSASNVFTHGLDQLKCFSNQMYDKYYVSLKLSIFLNITVNIARGAYFVSSNRMMRFLLFWYFKFVPVVYLFARSFVCLSPS